MPLYTGDEWCTIYVLNFYKTNAICVHVIEMPIIVGQNYIRPVQCT